MAARLGVAAAALLPGLAAAQQAVLEPSPAVRCLTPRLAVETGPEYPFIAFKHDVAGRVKIELEFTDPDKRPSVKVIDREGPPDNIGDFVDAVRNHVSQFRVPCLKVAEGPVTLVQEYVFSPDRRKALSSRPEDAHEAEHQKLLGCVVHESGRKQPEFPEKARRDDVQGRVQVRLRFDAPDKSPHVEVFARPTAKLLRLEVERWVKGLRMPCHAGAPVIGSWTYAFVFKGGAYGFKPLVLQQLLASTRRPEKQALSFDTATMNCPFDIRFNYRQPMLPNIVSELPAVPPDETKPPVPLAPAGPHPARAPLLEWLEGVELDLSPLVLDNIFLDTALVTVPCIKIDLKPKEKS